MIQERDWIMYISSITKDDFREMDVEDKEILLTLHNQINGSQENRTRYRNLMSSLHTGQYNLDGLVNPDFKLAEINRKSLDVELA